MERLKQFYRDYVACGRGPLTFGVTTDGKIEITTKQGNKETVLAQEFGDFIVEALRCGSCYSRTESCTSDAEQGETSSEDLTVAGIPYSSAKLIDESDSDFDFLHNTEDHIRVLLRSVCADYKEGREEPVYDNAYWPLDEVESVLRELLKLRNSLKEKTFGRTSKLRDLSVMDILGLYGELDTNGQFVIPALLLALALVNKSFIHHEGRSDHVLSEIEEEELSYSLPLQHLKAYLISTRSANLGVHEYTRFKELVEATRLDLASFGV